MATERISNGDMIKAMFPNATIETVKAKSGFEREKIAVTWNFEQLPSYYNFFYKDWWDAEYKEPTIKKDLVVEAELISMDVLNNAIDHVEDYVCNHEKNTYRAQGMCDALTMIEEYIKEQTK